jgi:hypothetical protein
MDSKMKSLLLYSRFATISICTQICMLFLTTTSCKTSEFYSSMENEEGTGYNLSLKEKEEQRIRNNPLKGILGRIDDVESHVLGNFSELDVELFRIAGRSSEAKNKKETRDINLKNTFGKLRDRMHEVISSGNCDTILEEIHSLFENLCLGHTLHSSGYEGFRDFSFLKVDKNGEKQKKYIELIEKANLFFLESCTTYMCYILKALYENYTTSFLEYNKLAHFAYFGGLKDFLVGKIPESYLNIESFFGECSLPGIVLAANNVMDREYAIRTREKPLKISNFTLKSDSELISQEVKEVREGHEDHDEIFRIDIKNHSMSFAIPNGDSSAYLKNSDIVDYFENKNRISRQEKFIEALKINRCREMVLVDFFSEKNNSILKTWQKYYRNILAEAYKSIKEADREKKINTTVEYEKAIVEESHSSEYERYLPSNKESNKKNGMKKTENVVSSGDTFNKESIETTLKKLLKDSYLAEDAEKDFYNILDTFAFNLDKNENLIHIQGGKIRGKGGDYNFEVCHGGLYSITPKIGLWFKRLYFEKGSDGLWALEYGHIDNKNRVVNNNTTKRKK